MIAAHKFYSAKSRFRDVDADYFASCVDRFRDKFKTEEPLDVIPVNVIPASVPEGGDLIESAGRVHTAQKSATDGTDHASEASPKPESDPGEASATNDG